jgi:hypothetical protein
MLFSATNSDERMINIMKPTEHSERILNGSCITFTEHTPGGDIIHYGKITSIDYIPDGVINCLVKGKNKVIGITKDTYNTNDWSTIKRVVCPVVVSGEKETAAWHSVARQFRPGGVDIPPDIEHLVASYLPTPSTTQGVSNERRKNLSEALRHANNSPVTDPLGATNSNGRPVLVNPYKGGKKSRCRSRRRKNRRTRSRK